jgi:hypothetical protein
LDKVLSSFKSPTTSFQATPTFQSTPTFQPPPPTFQPSKPTPEEIERDVEIIFRNMGLDRFQNP